MLIAGIENGARNIRFVNSNLSRVQEFKSIPTS
jgi:hypothetical protein